MNTTNTDKRVFVLMPFNDKKNTHWTTLIQPVIEESGLTAVRADSILASRSILKDIIQGIDTAALVIADLTGLNANVMYELGVAHGLGRPTLLITEDLAEVPFDLKGYRILEYSWEYHRADQFRNDLRAILELVKQGSFVFGSPVTDFVARPGSSPEAMRVKSDQSGLLELAAEAEDRVKLMLESLNGIEGALNDLGSEITAISIQVREAGMNSGQALPIRLLLAKDISETLERHVAIVDRHLPEYRQGMRFFRDFAARTTEFLTDSTSRDGNWDEIHTMLSALEQASGQFAEMIQKLIREVRPLRQLSRSLSLSVNSAMDMWQELLAEAEALNAICRRSIQRFV